VKSGAPRACLLTLACLVGCSEPPPAAALVPAERGLTQLVAFAVQRAEEHCYRAEFDPRAPPDARALLGPDPSRIVKLERGGFALLLSQPGEVVLLDDDLHELDRRVALPGATALAVDEHGTLWVGAKTRPELVALRVAEGKLERAAPLDRPGFTSIGARSVATLDDCVYAVDEHASELAWSCGEQPPQRLAVPTGPVEVTLTAHFLAVTSPVAHTVSVFRHEANGVARADSTTIRNDGPFFGTALLERSDGSLLVASGGIEDHPLDRAGGSFGFIDSFVYLRSVEDGHVRTLASVDVSELGVITPKALSIAATPEGVRIRTTGYGAAIGAVIDVTLGAGGVSTRARVQRRARTDVFRRERARQLHRRESAARRRRSMGHEWRATLRRRQSIRDATRPAPASV